MTAGNNNSNTVFVVPQATSAICDDVAYYQSCNPALIVDYSPSTEAEYPQGFVVSEELEQKQKHEHERERERDQQDRQPNVTNKTKRKTKPKTPARKSGRSSATGKKPKTWCPAETTTTTTATSASRLPLKKRKQFPAPRPGQFDDAPEEEARAPRSSLAPPPPSSAGGATKRASPAAVSNPRDTPRAPKRHRARPSRVAIPAECFPSHRLPVGFEKKRDQKTIANKNNYKNNYTNNYTNNYKNNYKCNNNSNNNSNGGQLCFQHFPLQPLVPTKRRSASENLLCEFQIMRIQQRLQLLREQQHFRQTGIMHTTAAQGNLRAKLLADAQGRYFDPFDQQL